MTLSIREICASTLFATANQFPLLDIQSPLFHALISPQGAQLLQFQAHGQAPLLYLDKKNPFILGEKIIGGIPLCLPWFGRHQNPQLPIHGYLQTAPWQYQTNCLPCGTVELVWQYQQAANAMFNYAFSVQYTMRLSAQIELTLMLHSEDKQAIPLSFAWHSYFAANARTATLSGLENKTYLDYLHNSEKRTQHGTIHFTQAIDAVFENLHGEQILHREQDTLYIHGSHLPTCIVWQPEQNEPFICVERGAAFADSLVLAQNTPFYCQMTIRSN